MFVFDAKAQVQATPRSWEYASKIMATSPDSDIEQELLAGDCWRRCECRIDWWFLRTCRSLPSVDQIINNPEAIDLENDPAVMYAVCSIIARKMDKKNISKFMKFLETLPDEFAILCMSDASHW